MVRFHVSKKERQLDDSQIYLSLAETTNGNITIIAEGENGAKYGSIITIDPTGVLWRPECNHVPGIRTNSNYQILTREEQIGTLIDPND